jgi:FMN phosphatase YigB (HAD superfamily)
MTTGDLGSAVKIVLFDLGNTLEVAGVLRPAARETVEAIAGLRDGAGRGALVGLISDFDMPADPAEIPAIQQRYYELLDQLGIRDLFEPVAQRVTLSTEVGQFKPAEAVFGTAVAKSGAGLALTDALFVTENLAHVLAARRLGLKAVHVGVPGGAGGEVDDLPDLVPLVRAFLEPASATAPLAPASTPASTGT